MKKVVIYQDQMSITIEQMDQQTREHLLREWTVGKQRTVTITILDPDEGTLELILRVDTITRIDVVTPA